MFSIIIPVFNKSAYIEKCLKSVFSQTFKAFEVIVVNDGSTDMCLEIVKKFIGSIVQHLNIINQANLGVSVARNNGVKAANFEYIAFLDADDWWEPTFLEEMKALIETFPDAGIYGCGYNLIKSGRKRIAPIGIEPSFTKGIINYFQVYAKTLCMPITSSSVVIRRSIFESENGFKPVLKLGEDFDLWVRVAFKYPFAFFNKTLANYNQDVEIDCRVVGNLQKPENHILWNLNYLSAEEFANPDLKQLVDNLRVYGLYPYYLNNKYRELAQTELEKIDWSKQTQSKKRLYEMPILLLKVRQHILKTGSFIKKQLLRLINITSHEY